MVLIKHSCSLSHIIRLVIIRGLIKSSEGGIIMMARIKDISTHSVWNADNQRWERYSPIVKDGCLIGIHYWEETPTWPDALDEGWIIIDGHPLAEELFDLGLEVEEVSVFRLATEWMWISSNIERD